MQRRDFVRIGLTGAALARLDRWPHGAPTAVALVADADDPTVCSAPVERALDALRARLRGAGIVVRDVDRIAQTSADERCIVACGAGSPVAAEALARAGLAQPHAPESLVLCASRVSDRAALVACGADARGLAYALRELVERVHADASLDVEAPIVERPANAVRSVMRQFTSEPLDKPWLYDREGWTRYLGMLATHRFNRLHLAFGLGYDTLQRVTDSYALFLYPFLLPVPGYDVRATNLPDAERDRNLEALRFVSEETVRHGLDFELGLWMHGWQMPNSPDARYVIEGLGPDTHAPYCRDALTAVLRACPAISAVGLRIHGESGIAEGSYDFWGAVMDGVARCGRRVEIDLHAKGIDATMIARAQATGMPVNVSPKFAAEHCGMPYHQAAIRELEMPVAGHTGAGLMTLSEGARVFTRYGYADLLREDRTYTVRPRVFAGTQRLLAWGDPAWAAASSRAFGFCGMTGADLMEPLTCRGRRGTGVGRRDGYLDTRLAARDDWAKYDAWYRAWGRTMYDPATPPSVFDRSLGTGARDRALASALASASRILPIVTTAHLPSAACDAYWPEIYWNQPMAAEAVRNPYGDSPSPKTFQHVSPLDPQLFSSIAECADELLGGPRSGRHSPLDVAAWLETLARRADADLARAGTPASPAARRVAVDVAVLAGLGRFFGAKLRAGVLYAIHERTGDRRALDEALGGYRRARDAWAVLVDASRGVYQGDLSVSDKLSERGQWADRLAGIDDDVARLEARRASASAGAVPNASAAVDEALRPPRGASIAARHVPPRGFRPGADVALEVAVPNGMLRSARLVYRHVNQAERWVAVDMAARGAAWRAAIPAAYTAAYTASPYPLQYYFALTDASGRAWLHPGFGADLAGQPYVVLRRI